LAPFNNLGGLLLLRRAFTLIELLVVIAIIAILAAILFPVFAQAKAQAKKTQALSNFKQQNLAYPMYENDSDDHVPPYDYNLTYDVNPVNPDSVAQLLVYPYEKNIYIYNDPLDVASDHDRIYTEQVVNPDTVPYKAAQTLFNYVYKSDMGLNWRSLDMIQWNPATGATAEVTISSGEIATPGKFIFAIDSVWSRTASGTPYGGGNNAVDEPCFFDQDGTWNIYGLISGWGGYYWFGGWNPQTPLAWNVFGGVWPWHLSGKQVVVAFGDSHAKVMPITQVAQGCNVVQNSFGQVTNQSIYMWSWRG
jgi:prepilin-type N-terminal cleavage/methylation domain-containing protein